ncbi:MAG: DUF4232 domain-containing protein, partial [Propionibacteriaceae bacterium]|nr:DUF4232 domain-containing protein [Propionibacteriaceae bacterium]
QQAPQAPAAPAVPAAPAAPAAPQAPQAPQAPPATYAPAPAAPAAPARQPAPAAVGDCQPGALNVSFEPDPAVNGPTYDAYLIWMTNTSTSACEILGFPGVAFASGPGGVQIGHAADRDRRYTPKRFRLEPGQQAASEVHVTEPARVANCQPTQANYVQVIVPNTWTAFLFPASITACSNPDAIQLKVRASRKVG